MCLHAPWMLSNILFACMKKEMYFYCLGDANALSNSTPTFLSLFSDLVKCPTRSSLTLVARHCITLLGRGIVSCPVLLVSWHCGLSQPALVTSLTGDGNESRWMTYHKCVWVIREDSVMKTWSCLLKVIMCEGSTTEWCLCSLSLAYYYVISSGVLPYTIHVYTCFKIYSISSICATWNCKVNKCWTCFHVGLKVKENLSVASYYFRTCQSFPWCRNMKYDTAAAQWTRIPKSQCTVTSTLTAWWLMVVFPSHITRAG